MAWTAPRTWTTGEIVTKTIQDAHVRDNLRYLKGLDGVPTIESGLIIDNTGGDEYLQIPSLTTTERDALTPVNGMIIYNETTSEFNKYENSGWADLADATDHGGLDGLADDDHTQYTLRSILTTRGDLYRRGAAAIERVALGTNGQYLKSDGTDAVWAAGTGSNEHFIPVDTVVTVGAALQYIGNRPSIQLDANGETCYFSPFQIPADFSSLTSCVVVLLSSDAAADLDWTVDTTFAAVGEAHNTHTDSATADTYGPTQNQIANLDISAALTGLAAGDVLGVKFTLDEANATAVNIFGYTFKYA